MGLGLGGLRHGALEEKTLGKLRSAILVDGRQKFDIRVGVEVRKQAGQT